MSRRGIATCVSARLSWWKKRYGGDDWSVEDFEQFFAREREFLAEARERWLAIAARFRRELFEAPEEIPLDELGRAVHELDWVRRTQRDLDAAEVLQSEASDRNVLPFRGRRGPQLVVDEGPTLPTG